MKLNNPYMKLVIEVDGKLFDVELATKDLKEVNDYCAVNLKASVIATDENGINYVVDENPRK